MGLLTTKVRKKAGDLIKTPMPTNRFLQPVPRKAKKKLPGMK
jgi:hypothetical protein